MNEIGSIALSLLRWSQLYEFIFFRSMAKSESSLKLPIIEDDNILVVRQKDCIEEVVDWHVRQFLL